MVFFGELGREKEVPIRGFIMMRDVVGVCTNGLKARTVIMKIMAATTPRRGK